MLSPTHNSWSVIQLYYKHNIIIMARKDRDAIFEQVIVLQKRESFADQGQGENGGVSNPGQPRKFVIAGGEGSSSQGAGPEAERLVQEGGHGEEERKVDLGSQPLSFDNGIYRESFQPVGSLNKGGENLSSRRLLFMVVVLNAVLCLVLVITLVLASVNYANVKKLKETTVSEGTFQATIDNSTEQLREQMVGLERSVTGFREKVKMLSQMVNITASELDRRVDIIQDEATNQGDMLANLAEKLDTGLSNSSQRLSEFSSQQGLILDSLEANVSRLEADVSSLSVELADLEARIVASPVDLFEDCQLAELSKTLPFNLTLSNDTEISLTVVTDAINGINTNQVNVPMI